MSDMTKVWRKLESSWRPSRNTVAHLVFWNAEPKSYTVFAAAYRITIPTTPKFGVTRSTVAGKGWFVCQMSPVGFVCFIKTLSIFKPQYWGLYPVIISRPYSVSLFDRLPRRMHIFLTSLDRIHKQGYKQTRERKARQSLGFLSPAWAHMYTLDTGCPLQSGHP